MAWYNAPVRFVLLVAAVVVGFGCQQKNHPWEQPDAGEAPGALTGSGWLPRSTASVVASGSAAPELLEMPAPVVRVGGPWVRCYGGFHPQGDPVKDVTRLSILCGPENGMRRLSKKPLQGSVTEGGTAVSERFEARRGECYRVFAVAEPQVNDLDVVVRSSRGAAVAADHGEDAWPIVQPDRPFCPLEDDRYTFEVSARRGSGRFAAEVWVLRSPPLKRP